MSRTSLAMLPVVLAAIRVEANRAWRSLRRFGYEARDLRQEFRVRLLEVEGVYDPVRSAPSTFATHNCRQRTLQLLEPHLAAKRNAGMAPQSLSTPVGLDEGAPAELADLIADDEYALRMGRRSLPAADLLALRLDVDRVVRGLPLELADVARLLSVGESVVDVARRLGISRATAHRRVAALRVAFQKAGLGRYVYRAEAA
jgi:hypothetical protein